MQVMERIYCNAIILTKQCLMKSTQPNSKTEHIPRIILHKIGYLAYKTYAG